MSTTFTIKQTPVSNHIKAAKTVVVSTMTYCVVESKILNATIKTNLFLS